MISRIARPSTLTHPVRLALLAGTAAAFALPIHADAVALSWANAAGGSAGTAGNWSPAQIPTAADALTFNLNNIFTTSFPGTTPSSTSHTYKRGTVTLNFTATHTTSSFVRVGDVSGDVATVHIASGDLIANGGVSIGTSSGATGTLTVDNEGTSVTTVTAGTDVIVGNSGTGTLNIADGASVSPADDVIVGNAATGVGHVTVSGGGTFPLPAPSSTLSTTAATGDLVVGNSGDGTLDVLAGGRVSIAGNMNVALNAGESGTVTVGGVGGFLNLGSSISVAGNMLLGQNPSSTSAGSASLTVNSGGVVTVTGATRLADTVAGSATLGIHDGATFTTGSLLMDNPLAFLVHDGGVLTIDGGTFDVKNSQLTVTGAGNFTPAVRLFNGATCALAAAVAPFQALTIGNGSNGQVIVNSGSTLTVTAGDILIGQNASATGGLFLTDGNLVAPADRTIFVGNNATSSGVLNTSGGTVSAGSIRVAPIPGSSGGMQIGLPDPTTMNLAGTLTIGGTTTTLGGDGHVRLNHASTVVNVNAVGTSVFVWDTSTLELFDATLNANSNVTVQGLLTLNGGTLNAVTLRCDGGGDVTGHGTIDASVTTMNTGSVMTLDGDLTAGNPLSITGFVNNLGTVQVGDHTLTLRDAGMAELNTCTIGPLGRVVAANGISIANGKTLTTDGTVEGGIFNQGRIITTGNGATFTGIVNFTGQGFFGAPVKFESTGGFTGGGLIDAEIDNRGTIIANADLSIGKSTSALGVRHDGTIILNNHQITLLDSNGPSSVAQQGNYDMTAGGILMVQPALNLFHAPRTRGIFGSGTLLTGLLRNGALVSVGSPTNSSSLTVNGDFINANGANSGVVEVRVFAPTVESRLIARGTAQLSGELRVTLANGHVPQPGETHTVLASTTANGVTGTFSTFTPGWLVQYTPTSVIIQWPCVADVDDGNGTGTPDGGVTIDDLLYYLAVFEAGDIQADVDDGSSTGVHDGGVTIDDLLFYLLRFESGC